MLLHFVDMSDSPVDVEYNIYKVPSDMLQPV
jgi:hypothetical protein